MKIFISWSGDLAGSVAEILQRWLQCVIQKSDPWTSKKMDRGVIWFSEISDQLKDTSIGIICLTKENKDRPWILFEAGALSKSIDQSRVCTLLIDLRPDDVTYPLAGFNHFVPSKSGMRELVTTLNRCLGTEALSEAVLGQVFETYWPTFEREFAEALAATPANAEVGKGRDDREVLGEILELSRAINIRSHAGP